MTVADIDVEVEAQAMVDRLLRHAWDEIVPHYAFPVAVYLGDELHLIRDADHMRRALTLYREILDKAGLAAVQSRVLQVSHERRNRFSVRVANSYIGLNGRVIGASQIRYFIEHKQPCPKIKMVEYEKWPCAQQIAEMGGVSFVFSA